MAVANKHLMDELYSFTTCDVLITDLETGIELYSGTLKSHQINKSSNKTGIKAGIGGITWVELEDSSEFTIEIVDLRERIDMESLKLAGSLEVPVETDFELTAFPKNYTIEAGGAGDKLKVVLTQTPIDNGQTITVYRTDNGIPIDPRRVSFNGKDITIDLDPALNVGGVVPMDTVNGLAVDQVVMVGSFKYQEAEAKVIKIAADQVGANVSVTLKQPLYGADRKVKMWRQHHFYRCSLGTEFSQSSATEMAEQNTTTTFTVLKDPKHEELGFIAYVPVTPAYGTGNAPFRR